MPRQYGQTCPVAKSLEFLGERWTLLIVRDLFTGPKKFHDFSKSLKGVAPGVLSHRLKVLEDHGIIRRLLYSEHPPRAEYILTERGAGLRPALRALAIWGAQHLNAELALVHDRCESPIEMAYYCPSCNELIAANAASYRPRVASRGETRHGAGESQQEVPAITNRARTRRAPRASTRRPAGASRTAG